MNKSQSISYDQEAAEDAYWKMKEDIEEVRPKQNYKMTVPFNLFDKGDITKKAVDPHVPGAKLDSDKPRLDLVLGGFSKALLEVGKVGTFGANKYTDNGWRFVDNARERYRSAELRHYFEEARGELVDPESSLYHAAHKAWNALADLELLIKELNKDYEVLP